MIKKSGDFDFINKSFFAVFLGVCGLFSKGLDGYLLLVSQTNSKVNGSKVSFAQPFFCFEEIVEVELIH